jgi:CHAD domain-containing protein
VTGTAGAVLVRYLAEQRDRLIAADLRMREPDPDAEAPHDLRAAARRIRSVLRVYRALLLPGGQERVASALQRLGGAISGARDLDVAMARLGEVAESSPAWSPTEGRVAVAGVRRRLAARRVDSLARARRELDSPEHVQLLRDLDGLIGRPPLTEAAHASPAAVLQPLLAAAWLRLRADAETARTALADSDDPVAAERMHRVRKDAKTVRYAAEAAAGSGGPFGEAIAAFATEVETVQDVLGAHQDAVTALALTDRLAEDPDLDAAERLLLDHWSAAESERHSSTRAEFTHLWASMPVLPPASGQ